MNESLQCCAGEHIPGETVCTRNSREILLALPSAEMSPPGAPWQVYPLCGVYHRGSNLAAMIRQADPQAVIMVFSGFSYKDSRAIELVPGQYSAVLEHPKSEWQ